VGVFISLSDSALLDPPKERTSVISERCRSDIASPVSVRLAVVMKSASVVGSAGRGRPIFDMGVSAAFPGGGVKIEISLGTTLFCRPAGPSEGCRLSAIRTPLACTMPATPPLGWVGWMAAAGSCGGEG
jgi:hypothetical protein